MKKPIICIDAGHSGKANRSPAVKAYYESDMNWKLHLLLKVELEEFGFEVITTRKTQNTILGVTARGKKSKGCALFLSLHSNAPDSKVHEELDYPLVIVQLDGKGHTLGRELADCIATTMDTKQGGRIMTKKGNNGEYYGVLRGAAAVGTMGMILEHSFHTNTRSTKWLLDERNLAKLAKAEAAVIAKHFKVNAEESSEDPLAVDGLWGRKTTERLQQIFNTPVDGVVSNQWETYYEVNPGLVGGFEWEEKPNGKGSLLIKAVQKWAGMPTKDQDGELGPKTIKAFQKKLGTPQDGYVSAPSQMVKALQKWINQQGGGSNA
jgi:N-acetylmuramoyl-L-alanine amidase